MKVNYFVNANSLDIVPTHYVKIKSVEYLNLQTLGSKMPAVQKDAGYMVLCDDGVYRYMSVMRQDIEVVGKFVKVKVS